MAKVQTSATVTTATKVAPALRAASIIAKGGMAGAARAIAATGPSAASAKRYGRTLGTLSPAFAGTTFTLTNLGKQTAAQGGCIGSKGQATVMGLFAVALANAGGTATGQAIVLAALGNPALMAQMQATKANGVHLMPANATAMGWAQGYVNGLTRPKHGLATR